MDAVFDYLSHSRPQGLRIHPVFQDKQTPVIKHVHSNSTARKRRKTEENSLRTDRDPGKRLERQGKYWPSAPVAGSPHIEPQLSERVCAPESEGESTSVRLR